jgi:hypothetical protein
MSISVSLFVTSFQFVLLLVCNLEIALKFKSVKLSDRIVHRNLCRTLFSKNQMENCRSKLLFIELHVIFDVEKCTFDTVCR